MHESKLITCILQRGKADKVVNAALNAGAQGATIYYARGTGIRQKLGILGKLIQAEKEVILISVKEQQVDNVFNAITDKANLNKPGMGFAYVQSIERAIGFLDLDTK